MPTVEPWQRPVPAPPQVKAEPRPTFEQAPSGARLAFIAGLAVVVGIAAHLLAGFAAWVALLLAVAFCLVMWCVDLAFTTGFLHKLMEERTENRRINSAMLDVIAVNQLQDAMFTHINNELMRLDTAIETLQTVTITEQGKTRTIARQTTLDAEIRNWLISDLYDKDGILSGTYPNGQVKGRVPFKLVDGDDEASRGYNRLLAAGLMYKNKGGYVWEGPKTLTDALRKLGGGQVE